MGFGELLSGNGLDTLSMPVVSVFSYEGDPFDSSYPVLSNTLLEDVVFYIHDHLGNTRVTYQAAKNGANVDYTLKGAFDYYPYGKTLRTFNLQEEKYLSTHHERDQETGFDYRGARFYDSDVARFLSLDPHAMDYVNLSDYVYVADNPIIYIDSDGKDTEFYSDNGILLYSAKDGLENAITIIPSVNLEHFTHTIQEHFSEKLELIMTDFEIRSLRGQGTSYMTNGMTRLLNYDNIVPSTTFRSRENFNDPLMLEAEYGNNLILDNDGNVRIGLKKYDTTDDSGESVTRGSSRPRSKVVGRIHSHDVGKKGITKGYQGMETTSTPSTQDEGHDSESGYFNIIISKDGVTFYNKEQQGSFTVPLKK